MLLCLSIAPAKACLWVLGTTLDGKRKSVSGVSAAKFLRMRLRMDPAAHGTMLERRLPSDSDFTNRNDHAVALIYRGDYVRAIELLEQAERERPGEYATAANLGTAFELSGRNEEALRWIQEGLRRDPNSHDGTEWLHAKILEAKIQAARNPNYFQHHSVLDMDHARVEPGATTVWVGGRLRPLKEVEAAIRYQLEERLQFVKTNDAPVASLLVDYAVITAATTTVENAKQLLQMALEFGAAPDKVRQLEARYDRIIVIGHIRQGLIVGSIAALVIAFLIHAVKKGWITYRRRPALTCQG